MELNNLCGKVWWVTAILLSFIGHVQAACYYSYYYYNYYCYYYYYYSYTYSSVGTIAGAVVGGIIGLACLVAFIVFCCYLAKKGHSRGVRGTVIRPQAQVTVVSSNQYPHQPMQPQPPPAYSAHQNYGPPPAYGPPPPPGPSYPPPSNPAYPPMASGSVPPPAPMYPGGKQ